MNKLDYSILTPGIRETVRWLRSWGFDTCDSGDGVTNVVAAGMEGAIETPHVHIQVSPSALRHVANRLQAIAGPVLRRVEGAQIEATYWPATDTAVVSLFGIDDGVLQQQAAAVVWGPHEERDQ